MKFPIYYCLHKNQSLLIEQFEVSRKGYNSFIMKSYKHVFLRWSEHFLTQSKYNDDSESLKRYS